jgi:TetR/AcrR family transcriptional repressor of nem operon
MRVMTEAPLERRLTQKGRATRDRIVAAAAELIALHGVAGTNTEQVRETAGVSGSQLYHYFDSKQALIRAVITRQADAAVLPDLGPLDSLDALRAWADAAIERQDDQSVECSLGTLAGELSGTDEESRVELSNGFLRWKEVLEAGLGRMRERGDLRPDADVAELAYALLAALQGGTLLSQTLRDTAPLRAAMNAALSYIRSFVTA